MLADSRFGAWDRLSLIPASDMLMHREIPTVERGGVAFVFKSVVFLVVLTSASPARLTAQTSDICPPALCAPTERSRGQRLPPLGTLGQVSIIVEGLSPEDKELGLNENELKEQVVVLLRNKVPGLNIVQSSVDAVHLKVALDFERNFLGQKSGFFGSISLAVHHAAAISGSGNHQSTEVWKKGFVMSGSLEEIVPNRVGSVVNRLTTLLAADWLEANP